MDSPASARADKNPAISILIVTWNSGKYLERCLENLSRQTFRAFEVLIIDNGSTDGSLDSINQRWPNLPIRLEKFTENRGFCVANNIGVQLATTPWVALLNSDAFPEPAWLENLARATEKYPGAFFSSCLLQANQPDRLDGEGDVYHASGLAWRRNYNLPYRQDAPEREIFSACAAAALYPRAAFLAVGGLDEDYFAYHEDVDLGFRLRLAGLKCYHIPAAIVHHIGSPSFGKHGDKAIYFGHRNLVWTFFKDMPAPLFWAFLPLHLFYTLVSLGYFTLIGKGGAIWRAKWDALLGLAKMLAKRRSRQNAGSAQNILAVIELNPLLPLVNMFNRFRTS
jgi:GT2 family glycosyltransferase